MFRSTVITRLAGLSRRTSTGAIRRFGLEVDIEQLRCEIEIFIYKGIAQVDGIETSVGKENLRQDVSPFKRLKNM